MMRAPIAVALIASCAVLAPGVAHAEPLTIGRVKTEGAEALSPEQVTQFVRTKLPQLVACNRKEKAAGTLHLRLLINASGHVIMAEAERLGNKVVEDCVARVMRNSRVPKPRFTKAWVDLVYAPAGA